MVLKASGAVVGIEEFIDDSKERMVVHGCIKLKPEDFVVHEISATGEVVRLSDDESDRLPSEVERDALLKKLEAAQQKQTKERLKFEDPEGSWRSALIQLIGVNGFEGVESVATGSKNEFLIVSPTELRERVYLQVCIQHCFPGLDCKMHKVPASEESAIQQIQVVVDPVYKKFREGGLKQVNCDRLLTFLRKGAGDPMAPKGLELEHKDTKEARTALHRLIAKHSSSFQTKTETRKGMQRVVVYFQRKSMKKRKRHHPKVYLQFVLEKTNVEHFSALEKLARFLRCPLSAFSYAGTKDKAARTFQHVVVSEVEPNELLKVNDLESGIRVGNLKYVDTPMTLGSAHGNKFSITIRDLSINSCTPCPIETIRSTLESRLQKIQHQGFVNYFGFQRVGYPTSTVRAHQIGEKMLASKWKEAVRLILAVQDVDSMDVIQAKRVYLDSGDLDAALKLMPFSMSVERQVLQGLKRFGSEAFEQALESLSFSRRLMYLHAYQSYLFNRMASFRLRHYGKTVVPGDLIQYEDKTVKTVTAEEAQELNTRCANAWKQVLLPLLGPNVILPGNAIQEGYMKVLENDGTKDALFASRWVKGAYRSLVASPHDVEWTWHEAKDEYIIGEPENTKLKVYVNVPPIFQTMEIYPAAQDPSSLRELEQLRVLAMYEFEPPLSNQELVGALQACNQHTESAYQYLKARRQGEKRRWSVSSLASDEAPTKRIKDAIYGSEQEHKQVDNVQVEKEVATASKARQLVRDVVTEQVSGRQPLRYPNWMEDVCKLLHLSCNDDVLEQLKLTLDALSRWIKALNTPNSHKIVKQEVALIVEILSCLSSDVVEAQEPRKGLNIDALSEKDTEVAAMWQLMENTSGKSAYDRAKEAKQAIECLSDACKVYMEALSEWAVRTEGTEDEKTQMEAAMDALRDKIVGNLSEKKKDVESAERAVMEAKAMKEKYCQEIVECVQKREKELLAAGETEASASLQSVVDVWKQKDVEVQKLWSARSESEEMVKKGNRLLQIARFALDFYTQLSLFYTTVREWRMNAFLEASTSLKETQRSVETRAATALETLIPKLTRALAQYYDFHAVQQAKAKEEVQEQEKALALHNEYFGDSAPIKKEDIERRIREFIGVTQLSMQVMMEIADKQQQLWENKRSILADSVRRVLLGEFKALWRQLSGPMQDVMKQFVKTIEETAGGVVVVEARDSKPASPNEEMTPAFIEPAFLASQVENMMTPYRTAVSAIVAQNVATGSTPTTEKKRDDETTNVTMTGNSAASPHTSEPRNGRHEFPIGSVLYSKIIDGNTCVQFYRGVVVNQLENDMYEMEYDTGERYTVKSSSLCTKETMEQNLEAGSKCTAQDTEMDDTEPKSRDGGCVIM